MWMVEVVGPDRGALVSWIAFPLVCPTFFLIGLGSVMQMLPCRCMINIPPTHVQDRISAHSKFFQIYLSSIFNIQISLRLPQCVFKKKKKSPPSSIHGYTPCSVLFCFFTRSTWWRPIIAYLSNFWRQARTPSTSVVPNYFSKVELDITTIAYLCYNTLYSDVYHYPFNMNPVDFDCWYIIYPKI